MRNINKCVYIHRNQNNEVRYIGCGVQARAYSRHGRTEEWNKAFSQGFKVEMVNPSLPLEEALKLEQNLIRQYGLDNLVNKTDRIIRNVTGIKRSQEFKDNLSKIQKGKDVTKDTKSRMKETHAHNKAIFGSVRTTEEGRKRYDAAMKKQSRRVMNLETGEIYKSQRAAAEALGMHESSLRYKVMNNKGFKYLDPKIKSNSRTTQK